jgi:hypothetical protein
MYEEVKQFVQKLIDKSICIQYSEAIIFLISYLLMYICSSCQYGSKLKVGKCPNCGEFGTMNEISTETSKGKPHPQPLSFQRGGISKENSLTFPLTNPEIRSVL